MIYSYKCNNIECTERNKEIDLEMPMSEAGETQYCEECKEPLQKIFGISGHSTFCDGWKG